MSRDFKPIEQLLADIHTKGGLSSQKFTLLTTDGKEEVISDPHSNLAKAYPNFYFLGQGVLEELKSNGVNEKTLKFVEHTLNEYVSTVKKAVEENRMLKSDDFPYANEIEKTVLDWFVGELDPDFYYSRDNNERFYSEIFDYDKNMEFTYFKEDAYLKLGIDKDEDVPIWGNTKDGRVFVTSGRELFLDDDNFDKHIVDSNYYNYIDGGGQNPDLKLEPIVDPACLNFNAKFYVYPPTDWCPMGETSFSNLCFGLDMPINDFVSKINENRNREVLNVDGKGVEYSSLGFEEDTKWLGYDTEKDYEEEYEK